VRTQRATTLPRDLANTVPRRLLAFAAAATLAPGLVLWAPAGAPAPAAAAPVETTGLPAGFVDETVVTGLKSPTAILFAPGGRVYVAEKRGVIQTWPTLASFNANDPPAATPTLDIRTDVMNFWDRGLLGLTADPNYPASPYLYVLYTYNALPGGSAPQWPATVDGDGDTCPNPPGATSDGCVVTNRLERITVNTSTGQMTARLPLLTGWCQQFPSHSAGSVAFGPDGMLYVSGGEGASFNIGSQDYGQKGGVLSNTPTPKNPCGDPPGGVGGSMTAPTAEGGALRSQSFRRAAGEPGLLNGTVLRLNPANGNAAAGNPAIGNADPIRQRIIAYGLRNPFRMTFRPGTSDLYVGDVGNQTYEEVNRIPVPTTGPTNFGWPCREGPAADTYYTSVSLNLCTSLAPGAAAEPHYYYAQAGHMASGDGCPPTSTPSYSASVSGLAFPTGTAYPEPYRSALFVADYSRNCIVYLANRGDGVPSSTATPFHPSAAAPVMLTADPNGNLVYVDFTGGTIHRIRFQAPVANFTATPSSGAAPLFVAFNGSSSTSPAGITGYDWDFGDGSAHGNGATTSHTYGIGTWTARLTVTDGNGNTATKTTTIAAGNTPPVVTLIKPSCTTSCWKVGDTIQLQASANDAQDGPLGGAAFSWHVGLEHCHSVGDCHEHELFAAAGVTSTSFVAPDHDSGSWLRITVTVTDSGGLQDTKSLDEYPTTSTIRVVTAPTALPVTLDGVTGNGSVGPATEIQGHSAVVSVPPTATVGETTYTFQSWSDGGAISHAAVVGASPMTLTATFSGASTDAPNSCASAPIRSVTSQWTTGRFGTSGDVDWFRFSVPKTAMYRFVLGNLPVDGVLALYSGCSTQIISVNQPGLHWEEILATLKPGTYALRMSSVGGASSATGYRWLATPLVGTTPILAAAYAPSSDIRLVGDVLNTTSTPRTVTVTARLYSAGGSLLKTVSVKPFLSVVPGRARTSFILKTTKPAGFAYVRFSVSSSAATRATRTLATTGVTMAAAGSGQWRVSGSVKNTSTSTATSVATLVGIYDPAGTPINIMSSVPASRTLAPGASSPFSQLFSGLSAAPNGFVGRARAS